MITKYIKGNLLDHDGPIAHGCNAQGKMNSGVAKVLRDKYPKIFDNYVAHLKQNEIYDSYYEKLVAPSFLPERFKEGKNPYIYNLITQNEYGYNGKRYVNYAWVGHAFMELNPRVLDFKNTCLENVLGIPKIGAGLGGGDWSIIEQIINDATPNIDIWVYEL